jgi:hypothetical protein
MFDGFFGGILKYLISTAVVLYGIWWAMDKPSWESIIGKKKEKKISKKKRVKKTNKTKKRNKKNKKND